MHGKLSSGLVSEGAMTYNELETLNLLSDVQLASPGSGLLEKKYLGTSAIRTYGLV